MRKGGKQSKEYKETMRLRMSGKNNPMFGKVRSAVSKQQQSVKLKSFMLSLSKEERQIMFGHASTEETSIKM